MLMRLGVLVATVAMLCSCAVSRPRYYTPDPAEMKLAEAAVAVSHSLNQLAEIDEAANPQARINEPPNPSSYGMGRLVSIDWAGPIEPLVARLARANGYQLRVLGVRPAVTVMVTISTRNTPMGDVLRNAGYQASERATIIVFPRRRIIELRYAPP